MTRADLFCFYVSLLKEPIMASKANSFFLTRWIKELADERKKKEEKRKTAYYEKEWDKKLRGLK